jgi:ubiquinone/menaquinone biosynthesis C-methylase UbiE
MSHKHSTIDYDTLAADYARHRRIHPGVLDQLVETGAVTAESHVLEVGCGTGNYLHALHEQTGCTCWGIDPSAEMLARARSHLPNATLQTARAEQLPFQAEAFDLVYSVDVIHHVADRSAYFREAHRVLTAGGRICTATDSADDIRRRRPLSNYFPGTVAVELARYPPISVLLDKMTAAHFTSLRQEHVELSYALTDVEPYRGRTFSSLHLISDATFTHGVARLTADLRSGPVSAVSLYTLLWGTRA